MTVEFSLAGIPFLALNGGPHFKMNPSISFFVGCESEAEIEELWEKLEHSARMELKSYPFAKKYGWCEDSFGVNWQLFLPLDGRIRQKITPALLFANEKFGKAREAIEFYVSHFPNSKVEMIADDQRTKAVLHSSPPAAGSLCRSASAFALQLCWKCSPGAQPASHFRRAGEQNHYASRLQASCGRGTRITLSGADFVIMEGPLEHEFDFSPAVSFVLGCESQEEVDRMWSSLSAVPEAEQCGWLCDRYGISWQVVHKDWGKMLYGASSEVRERLMSVILEMKKPNLELLSRAASE